MNIKQYMEKHGLTDEALDEIAKPYEEGDFPHEEGTIYTGSHLDRVGKKRVTVIFDAADTLEVSRIAQTRGVKPSDIYRDALKKYLYA